MSGIAGSDSVEDVLRVNAALDAISHRGPAGMRIVEANGTTLGQVWPEAREHVREGEDGVAAVLDGEVHNWYDVQPGATSPLVALEQAYREQGPAFVEKLDGHFALAVVDSGGILLARDLVGVVPLYYSYSANEKLTFASEVKGLYALGGTPTELRPGHYLTSGEGLVQYAEITPAEPLAVSAEELATELRHVLVAAVAKRMTDRETGCWLSGGIDSSVLAGIARQQTAELRTFAVGLEGAPDLQYARMVADHIGAEHHERVVTRKELFALLPEVIHALESFDALLVRSSITNYAVGKLASEHVSAVLSGEGGDELFAGYSYLKELSASALPDELVDITKRLHNTALQRVDRCSKAHGLIAHVPFLDQDVVSFALSIPARYKLNRQAGIVEKWILRRAAEGLLPNEVLNRPKAKFWEGAGVQDVIKDHAEETVSDADFRSHRNLPDGTVLNTKEELMYYRFFCERFGEVTDTSFVGRSAK